MAEEVTDLLVEQSLNIHSLGRVLVNFKKLAKVNVTLPKTKGRLADLKQLWDGIQRLHVRLHCLTTAEQRKTLPYFAKDEFVAAEATYIETADYLHDTISRFANDDLAERSTDSIRDSVGPRLQLSRIALPKFSGKFTEWENFRGIFESLVAANDSLSNTQKLHYLKASVTDEAALLINNIQISNVNYEAAWQLLVDEYDNSYAIIHAHIRAFSELSAENRKRRGT